MTVMHRTHGERVEALDYAWAAAYLCRLVSVMTKQPLEQTCDKVIALATRLR